MEDDHCRESSKNNYHRKDVEMENLEDTEEKVTLDPNLWKNLSYTNSS